MVITGVMRLFQNLIVLFFICVLASCKEEYYPKVNSSTQSVLVVEGVINSGNGPTTIKLTRTTKLDDSVKVRPELGAQLSVEGENGASFSLADGSANGSYSIAQLQLDPAEKYRLKVTTADGKQYASDYVPVIHNPPIDSVNWRRDSAGVQIYVNTHNRENSTRYYRWEYEETWEINSSYFAHPIPDDGIMDTLYPGENIYNCWKYYNSSYFILATTSQLASDVVYEKPLIKIEDGEDKLSVRYTVLVRQYALDKQGYAFYQLMKKNTESLGSIFDAQPTEITGNVHALSNAAVPVIGYVTATTIDSTRLWISKDQVPHWKPWADCSYHKNLNPMIDDISSYISDHSWLIYASSPSFVSIAQGACVSCRIRGGSTHKPSYW